MESIKNKAEQNVMKKLHINYGVTDNDFKVNEKGTINRLQIQEKKLKKIPEIIKYLTRLESLYLDGNEITQLSNLEKFHDLTTLSLSRNKIKKMEGLEELSQLHTLLLARNQIEKIEGLENLSNLKMLFLSDNKIKKIEGLEYLTQLQALYLARNQISRLENLEHLKNLKSLRLHDNPLSEEDKITYEQGIKAVIEKCKVIRGKKVINETKEREELGKIKSEYKEMEVKLATKEVKKIKKLAGRNSESEILLILIDDL